MNVFFVFDETSDAADGTEVRRLANIMMDALYHPDRQRPNDEWIGGEMTRQLSGITDDSPKHAYFI